METFRYPAGSIAGQTLTVAELRNRLAEFPDEMPIFAEWEGVHSFIEPDRFEVQIFGYSCDDKRSCLIINVDLY